MKKLTLGAFEEIVLLAVAVLGDEAYGANIKREMERSMGKTISLGALYAALLRLGEKGWVDSRVGGIVEKPGGRRKQYYDITKEGVEALQEVKAMRDDFFQRIPQAKLKWTDL